MKRGLILSCCVLVCSCNISDELDDSGSVNWTWIKSEIKEKANKRIVHQELFGQGNAIRLLQSMSMFDNKAFCFIDGVDSYIFDINSKEVFNTGKLPEKSHHNNAQFLDVYYQEGDKYPLLLLSKGNYPPDQNECFIVRLEEINDSIKFTRIKTIKNNIEEAKNGGSWVADTSTNTLYMYAMTNGDWRVKENNVFCVFSFPLPNVLDSSECTLKYSDIINYWNYSYLIHQGGTFYKGYLFFNVQSLPSINGLCLDSSYSVLAINSVKGEIEAVLPLDKSLETEGISILNDKLYISHKNGNPEQSEESVVFRLYEYSLPMSIVNKSY